MSHKSHGLYQLLERASVYELFQKLLGARRARTRFVEEFLRPREGARLLDIGCGTGSLLDYLPEPIEYVGFDLNPRYIEAARRRYDNRGQFHCARIGDESAAVGVMPFDFIVAKGLLHHLSDDDAHHLLAMARRLLRPEGVFVSFDNAFHDGQSWLSKTLTSLDRGGQVRSPEAYRALVRAHFPDLETWLLVDMLPIPYSHFIVRASLGNGSDQQTAATEWNRRAAVDAPDFEGEATFSEAPKDGTSGGVL
jgi:SAM-dependent methyltransferase